MKDVLRAEGTRFAFSLLFLTVCLLTLWFLYPKILERAGGAQAAGFWKREREENEKRLFGGED
jgi:hypothetical protein